LFIDFVIKSGLRFVEAINSYNLIIDLAREDKLKKYYNEEKEVLEHYRFKPIFIRGNKKVFLTFIPRAIVEAITKQEKVTQFMIDDAFEDVGLKMRFSDIREYYATIMTQYLTQPEIDFLQGRVSGSVFMRNYFNPALITDLKARVFNGIAELSKA
jgi:intergrase/recombinase